MPRGGEHSYLSRPSSGALPLRACPRLSRRGIAAPDGLRRAKSGRPSGARPTAYYRLDAVARSLERAVEARLPSRIRSLGHRGRAQSLAIFAEWHSRWSKIRCISGEERMCLPRMHGHRLSREASHNGRRPRERPSVAAAKKKKRRRAC